MLSPFPQALLRWTRLCHRAAGVRTGSRSSWSSARASDPPYLPYAPALANAGVRLDRLLIIDGKSDTDALWATEQILRTQLFTAVAVWIDKSNAQKQRRLQLAAETGRTWAAVYRPAHALKEHSPVSVRMAVSPTRGGLNLELIKVRGGGTGTVTIALSAFDRAQGVEWPGMPTMDT